MKCDICKNYMSELDRCKFCSFEYDESSHYRDDDWDILSLDDDDGWTHEQIMVRLFAKGIKCLMTDIWWDNNLAYVIGADASAERVADALNIYRESVYDCGILPMFILDLRLEKELRMNGD